MPECLWFDLGGEFESSFSELAEQIGCRLLPATSVSPTQNAPCERAGGAWKYRARRLVDQFSIKWNDSSTKLWLCAVLNWSTNTAIGDSGHSPSQWVLGRSLRLPFQLLSRASQLASHQRHRDDFACQRRVAMLAEAQRSIISTRKNKALSRAFLSRARSANNSPSQVRFAVGDQVMCWRGNNKRKSQWSMRWLGPGIVIGHEGRANVWISHRNAVVKAAGVRLAEVEEQLPWHDLYDSLRDTDEQTYFDLSPPGVSRDPQYGGPSTSSDFPMTPVPVTDESMQDAIANEPDTSEIPVLPNSVYAPVRNPRVRWRSDVLGHSTPQTVSPPVVSSQNVPAATPSWSPPLPVTRETPSVQQPVTPHIDVQPGFPPPASSADDDPVPLPHVDDTPPCMGLSGTGDTVHFYRARYTSDHATASAVATHTGFSITKGDKHVHW